jgi:hypothetical protein
MAGKKDIGCEGLVIIKHPQKGDADSGKAICDSIRKTIPAGAGHVCIFHDATEMGSANAGYAGAFKELDKEISGRVTEIVCAIPGSIPRMMAHTVAMFSDKKWSIFKEKDEAVKYLEEKGFDNKKKADQGPGTVGFIKS